MSDRPDGDEPADPAGDPRDREASAPPGPGPGAAGADAQDEIERRYARPEADRLPPDEVARFAATRTGAEEAAFFDLDKTVIARSSTLAMSRAFRRDGLLTSASMLRSLYAQVVYQLLGADHGRMEQMRSAALELTRGWEAERVQRLVRETLDEVIAPLVYREAVELIAAHRRAGRDVWLVSSSGEEIVGPLAAHLGIDDVIATRSGIDADGRYDGTLAFYAYGGAKATAIRQVAGARGYDLTRCYAYSDSVTDLPMLTAVGHPTVVNPDRELRAAATAMGWEIRDFHAPVRLRDRLPSASSSRELVGGALVAGLAGLLVWRYRDRTTPGRRTPARSGRAA